MRSNGRRLRDECAGPRCTAQSSSDNDSSSMAIAAVEDAGEMRRVVVALFHDGFVCRHVTPARANIEGFAQPYDAESRYFLSCIENGQLPDGLADVVDCTQHEDGVVAEIWDYRGSRTVCPLSSVALPQTMPLSSQNRGCKVWKVMLRSLTRSGQIDDMFGHFPELTAGELESLAGDAERQLLEGSLLASWNEAMLDTRYSDIYTTMCASGSKEDLGWDTSFQECVPVLYQGRMEGHLSSEDGLVVTTRSIDECGAYQRDGGEYIKSETNSDEQVHHLEPDTDVSSPKCEGSRGFLLTLDKDAFPGLLSAHHLAAPALLSPTEPKKQVINDSQRQKVVHQAKKRAIGNGQIKEECGHACADQALNGTMETKNVFPNQVKQPQSLNHTHQVDDSSGAPPLLDPERRARTKEPGSSPLPTTRSVYEQEQEGCSSLAFYSALPPLPATQHFLSKLKGKRQRPRFEPLDYGMPVRLILNHIGLFSQAATKFERQHALFLHSPVGSMNYLAGQLGALEYPTQVIDVAKFGCCRQLEHTAATASDDVDWGVEQTASPRRLAGAAAVMGEDPNVDEAAHTYPIQVEETREIRANGVWAAPRGKQSARTETAYSIDEIEFL
ncbi:hypothetical protein FI667_g4925, partial [Globisporangium splendens]